MASMKVFPMSTQAAVIDELGEVCGLGRVTRQDFLPGGDLVCVTLYNEPLSALWSTLASLAAGASHHARHTRARPLCICIMVDGVDRLDPEVAQYLVQNGFAGALLPSDRHWPTCFLSVHTSLEWADAPQGVPLHFIVCLKRHNLGKLHSHALFFGSLCPWLEPVLCFQIDAGTTVAPQALSAMVAHFDSHPHAAAVGSRVAVAVPAEADGFLQRWQHMDFAVQLAAGWPAELAAGHLSVVPGQFCAFRWQALRGEGQGETPVMRYLRGMSPSSQMERIMFLAEDRVIGNEIVFNSSQHWRLDYCEQAHAQTDACPGLTELLRQRRRWNNCSFACRLWLLGQAPTLWARPELGAVEKLRLSGALLWQALLACMQVLTPVMVLGGWLVSAVVLAMLWERGDAGLASAIVGLLTAALVMALRTPESAGRRWLLLHGWARDVMATVAVGAGAVGMLQVLPSAKVLLLMLPLVLLPVLTAWPCSFRDWRSLRHVPEYVLFNGFVQLLLWTYSLVHLHDTSWGTKGLVGGQASPPLPGTLRYSRVVMTLSIAVNAGALVAAWWWGGAFAEPSNLLAEAAAVVTAAFVVMAVAGDARLAWRRLRVRLADRVLRWALCSSRSPWAASRLRELTFERRVDVG